MPEIQGHRGARALRPENTLPGFAYALDIGVDAIEFDVTLTIDGGLILAHDLTVDPQTIKSIDASLLGKPWRALTRAEVATFDAGYREPAAPYDDTFVPVQGTAVPTLDQVCALVTARNADNVTLAVELKTDPAWPDADIAEITWGALRTLAAYGLTGRARILAFDWRVLAATAEAIERVALLEQRTWQPGSRWLAGLDPAGYGAPDPVGCVHAARVIGADWISPDDRMTSAELISVAHAAGLRVSVWTVNDTARAAELAAMGADAIVTDRPDLLRRVVAR